MMILGYQLVRQFFYANNTLYHTIPSNSFGFGAPVCFPRQTRVSNTHIISSHNMYGRLPKSPHFPSSLPFKVCLFEGYSTRADVRITTTEKHPPQVKWRCCPCFTSCLHLPFLSQSNCASNSSSYTPTPSPVSIRLNC